MAGYATKPYVLFESDTNMTINPKFSNTGTLEYSIDTENWNSINSGEETSSSKKLYFRGTMSTNKLYTSNDNLNNPWVINNGTNVKIKGNLNTLLNYNTPPLELGNYGFCYMFRAQTSIIDILDLLLPATSLGAQCYHAMFQDCTGLIIIPENLLPATNLVTECYMGMFYGCTSLVVNTESSPGYSREFRIPTSGTATTGTDALTSMFITTAGTMNTTPAMNTTYYIKTLKKFVDKIGLTYFTQQLLEKINALISNIQVPTIPVTTVTSASPNFITVGNDSEDETNKVLTINPEFAENIESLLNQDTIDFTPISESEIDEIFEEIEF